MASKHELQELHLRIENSFSSEVLLILEPWGEEHAFPSGDVIEVVANGPGPGSLDLDITPKAITVWGWEGSTVFLFRDGVEFAGGQERPRVPLKAYPRSIAPLTETPTNVPARATTAVEEKESSVALKRRLRQSKGKLFVAYKRFNVNLTRSVDLQAGQQIPVDRGSHHGEARTRRRR